MFVCLLLTPRQSSFEALSIWFMENVSQTKIYSLRVPVVGQPEKKADEGEKEVMEDDIEIEGKNKSYRL